MRGVLPHLLFLVFSSCTNQNSQSMAALTHPDFLPNLDPTESDIYITTQSFTWHIKAQNKSLTIVRGQID